MFLDEMATYIGTNVAALTVVTSGGGNLWKVPFPKHAEASGACIVELGGEPAIRGMGPSVGDPIAEIVNFQVIVRTSDSSGAEAVRSTMRDVHEALDHMSGTLSLCRYLYVEATSPPIYLGQDENERHRWLTEFTATKERST